MNILHRYVLMQFLRMALLCQAGVIVLFFVAEFIERVDDFIEKKAALIDCVLYLLFRIPQLAFLSVPLTVLLASTLTLILLARNNEVVAMRAGGWGLYRVVAPVLAAGLTISLLTFLANEYVVPFANKRAEYVWRVRIQKAGARTLTRRGEIWYRSPEGTIWRIAHHDAATGTMRGITLFRMSPHNRLTRRIDAREALWSPESGRWTLRRVVVHDFGGGGRIERRAFDEQTFALDAEPADFQKADTDPETMTYHELGRYVEKLRQSGVDPTRYVVDMWAKISTPFISFVLVLVSAPLAIRSNRRGGLALGVAIAIGIGAVYLVVFYASLSFGHAGRLPPLLAAWGPNALFLTGSAYLLSSMRA